MGGREIDDDSLLSRVGEVENPSELAFIGGWGESDASLAFGFLSLADAGIAHWKEHGPDDLMALPILFNYRHSIELALKESIRDAARCVRLDGDDSADLAKDAIADELAQSHSIGKMADRLNGLLNRLDLEERSLPEETQMVLTGLHALDGNGQALRYSTVKVGRGAKRVLVRARPDQKLFDLVAVAAALHDAASLLMHGVSGVLDAYREWQDEMIRDAYS